MKAQSVLLEEAENLYLLYTQQYPDLFHSSRASLKFRLPTVQQKRHSSPSLSPLNRIGTQDLISARYQYPIPTAQYQHSMFPSTDHSDIISDQSFNPFISSSNSPQNVTMWERRQKPSVVDDILPLLKEKDRRSLKNSDCSDSSSTKNEGPLVPRNDTRLMCDGNNYLRQLFNSRVLAYIWSGGVGALMFFGDRAFELQL